MNLKKTLLGMCLGLSAAVASADIPVEEILRSSQQMWNGTTNFAVTGPTGSSKLSMKVWVPAEKGRGGTWEHTNTIRMRSSMIITANLTFNSQVQGVPGLIFIGAYRDGRGAAYMTSSGWAAFEGGLLPPYAIAASGMPSQMTVTLLDKQAPCDVYTEGGEIYAGYGLMTPQNTDIIQTFMRVNMKHTPEHLAHTMLANDAQVNKRYWKIMDLPSCDNNDKGHN